MITRLIFVCTENTCQSPMAEAVFRNIDHDLDLEVCSRGLIVLFSEPVNPKVEQVLATHGMLIGRTGSRQFRTEEVDKQTLILTMTVMQKRRLATDFFVNENVYTIREFAGIHGDVPDPYGRPIEEYEACFEELYSLMEKVVYRLMYGKLPEDEAESTGEETASEQ